jgi:polyhydroxybutyrate depolymerase
MFIPKKILFPLAALIIALSPSLFAASPTSQEIRGSSVATIPANAEAKTESVSTSTAGLLADQSLKADSALSDAKSDQTKTTLQEFISSDVKAYLTDFENRLPDYHVKANVGLEANTYQVKLTSKGNVAPGKLHSAEFVLRKNEQTGAYEVVTESVQLKFKNIEKSIDGDSLYRGVHDLAEALTLNPFLNTFQELAKITVKEVWTNAAGDFVKFEYADATYTRLTRTHVDPNAGPTKRTAWVNLPPTDGTESFPLVLNFHGTRQNGAQQMIFTGMNASSNQEGYMVVYPDAIGLSWNTPIATNFSIGLDDVGFVDGLIDGLEAAYPIDESRLYATGISNGGMLVYTLAAQSRHAFAAIAVAASGITESADFEPANPLPVMVIHGTGDFYIPYNGGDGILQTGDDFFAVESELIPHLLTVEGLPSDTTASTYNPYDGYVENPGVELSSWGSGDNELVHIKVNFGGHTWPGGSFPQQFFGYTTPLLDANKAIWDFFSRHTL